MELRKYLFVLRRWWWLLVGGTLIAASTSFVVTLLVPPTYEAKVTLLVNVLATPGVPTLTDALLSQQLVKTYSQMAEQPVVLEQVIRRLGLPLGVGEVARMVKVQPIRDTQLLNVVVEGRDPAQVRDIANTVAAVFIQQQNQRLAESQASNAISVVQEALLPVNPIAPRPLLNVLMAAAAGLLLMFGLVFLLEYLDDTIKTPEDLERAVGLPVLASVTRFDSRDQVGESGLPAVSALASHRNGGSATYAASNAGLRGPAAEAYRLLRTNLDFSAVEHPLRVLLVASVGPREGKSTTVANLALVLAQAGRRVLVVDTDLRRPSLHSIFKLDNGAGFTNLLLAHREQVSWSGLNGYAKDLPDGQVRVLTTGPLPPNPAELLQSARCAELFHHLRDEADIVLLDSAPILSATDTLLLAKHADGTILVIDSERTRADALRRGVAALGPTGARVLGVVLNKLNRDSRNRYGYYDYYYGTEKEAPKVEGSGVPS